jgi:GlcNAc-P-P-Und epimerase
MKRLLVTGGSGFIGTNLIHFFSYSGYEVLNLDISPPIRASQFSFWRNVDLCDAKKLLPEIISFSPELVIHLGARTDLRGKVLSDYKANTEGVGNLLNALDNLPALQKVIFASSMYVCRPGYQPQNFDDYNPHTIYGQSKVMSEQIIKARNPGYSWCIIRPTSIWGPYFGEPYNLFFKLVLSNKYFHLGRKACKKTYGYIDNTIYQIESIIKSPDHHTNKKVFYLGDYRPYPITEWANDIAACVNRKIRTIPYFVFVVAARAGDILTRLSIKFPMTSFRLENMTTDNVYDLSLIESIAPSLPVTRLEGTKKTINWLKSQKL